MLEKIQEQRAEKGNEIIESVLRELSDTGAYEKEVNGCTEFLRGINYSINAIYKAEKRNERVDEVTGELMINTKGSLDNDAQNRLYSGLYPELVYWFLDLNDTGENKE